MKIKFRRDCFVGDDFYLTGEVASFPEKNARLLIQKADAKLYVDVEGPEWEGRMDEDVQLCTHSERR